MTAKSKEIIKNRVLTLLMCFIVSFSYATVMTYAEDEIGVIGDLKNSANDNSEGNISVTDDQEEIENFITNYFGSSIFEDTNLSAGYSMAKPFASMSLILTLAIVIVILYAFSWQTAIDLLYLTIPSTRSFFNDKKEAAGGFGGTGNNKSKKGFLVISDSALEAVGGGSSGMGGGIGGGREREVGSSLLKYVGLRTTEMITFVLFIIFIFTGMISKLMIVIFRFFMSLFDGLLNLA